MTGPKPNQCHDKCLCGFCEDNWMDLQANS